MIQLTIRPHEYQDYLYDVDFEGERLLNAAKDPEHAAARVLLALGYTGIAETLGETGRPRMRFDIESFAGSFVEETSKGGLKVKSWRGEASERLPTGGSDA